MEFMEVISKRKSVRNFSNKHIEREILNKIVEAAWMAPVSHKQYESLKLSVVTDSELLREISQVMGKESDPTYGATALIIISSSKAEVEGIDFFNTACIMENILLAATNEGVGSIYLTKFLERITPTTELFHKLNIPTGFIPLSATALGYSVENQEKYSVESMNERIPTVWL